MEELNFGNIDEIIKELIILEEKSNINLDKRHFHELRNKII